MKMSVLDVTYPPDRELHLDSFKKLVIGKIPSYILEKRFQRKDGSLIWVRLNVSSIRDE